MASYITQADLENAVGADIVLRLLDDNNDGVADATALAFVIDSAESEAEGYIGRVYSVATMRASPPATVRRIVVDLAIQFAYLRRPSFLNDRGETPWESRYKRAVKLLDDIGKGDFRLDIDSEPQAAGNVGCEVLQGPSDDYPDGVGEGTWGEGFGDF